MHKLTDNEYLPDLTDGYRWNISLRSDGHAVIRIQTLFFMGNMEVVHTSVAILNDDMDESDVKEIILTRARCMVEGFVPWNPEKSRIFNKVIDDITPPNDTDSGPDKDRFLW